MDGPRRLRDAAHEVAAHPPRKLQRALEVHEVARLQFAKITAPSVAGMIFA